MLLWKGLTIVGTYCSYTRWLQLRCFEKLKNNQNGLWSPLPFKPTGLLQTGRILFLFPANRKVCFCFPTALQQTWPMVRPWWSHISRQHGSESTVSRSPWGPYKYALFATIITSKAKADSLLLPQDALPDPLLAFDHFYSLLRLLLTWNLTWFLLDREALFTIDLQAPQMTQALHSWSLSINYLKEISLMSSFYPLIDGSLIALCL